MSKVKKILAILLVVLFVTTVTGTAVSAFSGYGSYGRGAITMISLNDSVAGHMNTPSATSSANPNY
jgi:hypothetical protein